MIKTDYPQKNTYFKCERVWWFSPMRSFTLKSFQNAVFRYFLKSYYTATTAYNIENT